jgi:hypothetical protein
MSRRFQFSLRALAMMVALVASPLGVYSCLRAQGNTLDLAQLAPGQPIRIRARFFRPSWESFGPVLFVFQRTSYPTDQSHLRDGQAGCGWYDAVETQRSWFVFWVAETTMPLPAAGRYCVQTIQHSLEPDEELSQQFIVEPAEWHSVSRADHDATRSRSKR